VSHQARQARPFRASSRIRRPRHSLWRGTWANRAALKSHPFTGQCPIAFDGQELIFEFSVGTGTQRIASCEVDIDWGNPLFLAVGVALGKWVPLPVT